MSRRQWAIWFDCQSHVNQRLSSRNLIGAYLNYAFGILADRVGRLPIVLCGYTSLIGVYLLLFGPVHGWPLVIILLSLYGFFYAATDGVLMALAGPILPEQLRTTGIALIQTGQALAYLVSAVLFGLAWQVWGPAAASRVARVSSSSRSRRQRCSFEVHERPPIEPRSPYEQADREQCSWRTRALPPRWAEAACVEL